MSEKKENILELYRQSRLWFIHKYVHSSINYPMNNNIHNWKDIWVNILRVYYECVHTERNRAKFYWILTTCLGKILISQKIDYLGLTTKITLRLNANNNLRDEQKEYRILTEVENSAIIKFQRNIQIRYDILIKHFIYLAHRALRSVRKLSIDNDPLFDGIMNKALKNIESTYEQHLLVLLQLEKEKKADKEINESRNDINVRIKNELNDIIENLFADIYKLTDPSSPDILRSQIALLPQTIVQYWVHFGPVYWLWFHLTAAAFAKMNYKNDNVDNELASMLKELFNNIDIFIGCNDCQRHFVIMRETKEYVDSKLSEPCDKFLIRVHETVRKNHSRNGTPVNYLNKRLPPEQRRGEGTDHNDDNDDDGEKNVDEDIKNMEKYFYNLRNAYRMWWFDV